MSNFDDFNAKLDDIMAIPSEKVQEPDLPVNVSLQETEDLYHWSTDDAVELKTAGITVDLINDLPVRAGACREAQSRWTNDFRSQQDAQKLWSQQSPVAYVLHDELLHTMRYAFRNDLILTGRIKAIADGTGHADMIQDLNDLKVLGQENPDLLTAVGFDLAKLDTAASLSDEMAGVLAAANGDKASKNKSKVIRDRAYCYMKDLVDEIRAAGKFVFWKDDIRLKGYSSQYRRTHRN